MSKPGLSLFFPSPYFFIWLSQLLAALPRAVVGGKNTEHEIFSHPPPRGLPRPWFRSWTLSFLSYPWSHTSFLNSCFLHREVEKSIPNGEVLRLMFGKAPGRRPGIPETLKITPFSVLSKSLLYTFGCFWKVDFT